MRQVFFLLKLLFFVVSFSNAQYRKQSDEDTKNWRYEIEGVGEGREGTYLVKIWSYSKNGPNVQLRR